MGDLSYISFITSLYSSFSSLLAFLNLSLGSGLSDLTALSLVLMVE